MKKLFKIFLFSLLIFPMVFCLTACKDNQSNSDNDNLSSDGQIPVYTGMEVSADVPVVTSRLSSLNFLSASSTSNKNFHGDSKPDKDKDKEETDKKNPFPNKPSVEDEIKSSLEIVGGEKKTYYSAPNNDVFITILLNNPDQYEIVSFTLNDKKYSSYMFEKGSDMEHLILKVDVGATIGFKNYTIDAIKYIDKTEIKDVLMNGDKSIEIGVGQENLVNASITNLAADLNTISFDLNLQDEHSIINQSQGYAKAVLYDGENISFKNINIESQKVVFTDLKPDTLYQISIVGYYDDLLGNGKQLNTILNDAVYTESIVLFDNILIGKYSASWEYSWFEEFENKQIHNLELFLDNKKTQDLQPNLTDLDDLLSNRNYKLIATYKNLNNQDETIQLEFTTVATETPVVTISLIEDEDITTSSVSFDLNITDIDNLGEVSKIEIFNNTENHFIDLSKLANYENITTSNLKSNTDYTIKVTYVYDLNDGLGEKELTVTKNIKTLDKIIPRVEIDFDENDISYTDITFDVNIHDMEFVGKLKYIELHDTEKIDEIIINLDTSLSNLKFSDLLSNKEYSIVVFYEYNLNDGTGDQKIIETAKFKTKEMYKPHVTLKQEPSIHPLCFSQLLIEAKIYGVDPVQAAQIECVSLYLGYDLICSLYPKDINNKGFYEFDGLLSNRAYDVKAIYSYDLIDGNGRQFSEYVIKFKTLKRETPSVEFVNIARTSSSISFNLSIVDKDNTNAKITQLYYKDAETNQKIGEVEIKDNTDFNNIVLRNLSPDTTYKFYALFTYNLSDGNSDKEHYSVVSITTLAATNQTINFEAFPSQDTITIDVIVSNSQKVEYYIEVFELYKDGRLVDSISSDERVFSKNVLSDTEYTIKVKYRYWVESPDGLTEYIKETQLQCITLKKEPPTMEVYLTAITQTSVSYKIEITDIYNTGKLDFIGLFKDNQFLTGYECVESGTISNLQPNTLYKIRVRYDYSLNSDKDDDFGIIVKDIEFRTLP